MSRMRAALGIGGRQLRRRRPATAALVVLVGLAGGVVMAAVAGASRTDSAMGRFVAYSRPEDLIAVVNGAQGDPSDPTVGARAVVVRSRVFALPQIAAAGRAPYIFLAANRRGSDIGGVNAFAAADTRMFRTIERPRLLDGRLPRPDRAGEAVVDDVTAAARRLHVGSRIRLRAFSAAQQGNPETTVLSKYPAPAGPAYTFHVVGVVRVPSGVDAPPASAVRDAAYGGVGSMELTPAFLRRYAADRGEPVAALPGMEIFRVRLRHGLADAPAFEHAVAGVVSPGDGQIHLGSDAADAAAKTAGAIRLESLALVLFAVLAGLAALVVLGQALSRQVVTDAADHSALAALGMARRELVMVPLVRAGVVAVGGAALAVAIAVALSPLTPIGLARRAEIDPGVSVDVLVLALGFVGVAVLTLGRGLVSAWRAAQRVRPDTTPAPSQPGWLRAAVAGLGLGPSAAAGLSMSGGPRRALAFRAALLAAVVAVTGVVAAVTFGVSLRHLVDTPREQGWNWDVFVGNPNAAEAFTGDPIAESLQAKLTRLLAADRYVGAFSAVALTDGTIGGHPTGIAGVEPVKGSILTRVVQGRSPRTADEIAVGRAVLERLHKRIGQTVMIQVEDHRATMRIVGESLQPTAGNLSTQLAGGAVTTLAGLQRLQPGTPAFQFAVRYRAGVDHDAARRSLLASFGREVLHPYPGGEIGNLARVDALPYVMAGLLVVLAFGALGLTLLGSVRSHRRDLAVLEAIGFVRRQVMATVAWQATTLALVAIIVGVPAGIALGRWTWRLVADNVGSVSPPIVPVALVLLVVPATLIVANLLAGGPAWSAGRVRPSEALRVE
jgi:FtsX-like permease family